MTKRLRCETGQSLVEFSMVLPLLVLIVLGIAETGYALLEQHVVTKLSREGSNLISRDVTLQDATSAMKNMKTRPVDFDNGSRMIFSVVKKVATAGTPNFDKVILYQRYEYGTLSAASALKTKGPATFGGAPNYEAANSDTNTNLQIASVPPSLVLTSGGMAYVTEIYTTYNLITPLDRFGITLPNKLYSIAYF
jgi:Flp pilus assembly protein TadG